MLQNATGHILLDIQGQVYGDLTVLSLVPNINKTNSRQWLCECKCGATKVMCGSTLRAGRALTCGHCNQNTNLPKREVRNLLLEKFDKLQPTAVYCGTNSYDLMYLCVCDCGKERLISYRQLTRSDNPTTNCGCVYAEKVKQHKGTRSTHGKTLTKEWRMWSGAKCRSKTNNLPFDLILADIHIPEKCPLLNITLNMNNSKNAFDSPSLDRIIPELGYVKGNIRVISSEANRLKSNHTLATFAVFYADLQKTLNEQYLDYSI